MTARFKEKEKEKEGKEKEGKELHDKATHKLEKDVTPDKAKDLQDKATHKLEKDVTPDKAKDLQDKATHKLEKDMTPETGGALELAKGPLEEHPEHGPGAPRLVDLERRVAALEAALGVGAPFIAPEERPDVGEAALEQPLDDDR